MSRTKWLILDPDYMLALFCHGNTITLKTEMGVPPDAEAYMLELVEKYDLSSGRAPVPLTGAYSVQPANVILAAGAQIAIRYRTEESDWPDIVIPNLEATG